MLIGRWLAFRRDLFAAGELYSLGATASEPNPDPAQTNDFETYFRTRSQRSISTLVPYLGLGALALQLANALAYAHSGRLPLLLALLLFAAAAYWGMTYFCTKFRGLPDGTPVRKEDEQLVNATALALGASVGCSMAVAIPTASYPQLFLAGFTSAALMGGCTFTSENRAGTIVYFLPLLLGTTLGVWQRPDLPSVASIISLLIYGGFTLVNIERIYRQCRRQYFDSYRLAEQRELLKVALHDF